MLLSDSSASALISIICLPLTAGRVWVWRTPEGSTPPLGRRDSPPWPRFPPWCCMCLRGKGTASCTGFLQEMHRTLSSSSLVNSDAQCYCYGLNDQVSSYQCALVIHSFLGLEIIRLISISGELWNQTVGHVTLAAPALAVTFGTVVPRAAPP